MSCSSSGFIIGYQSYGCCCPHFYQNIALNDLMFFCSTGENYKTEVSSNDGDHYGWSNNTYCPSGTAVCGFMIRFQEYDINEISNTALDDLKLECCQICNSQNSVYSNGIFCNFCNSSCLTCSSDNICDSCGESDTLLLNKCIPQSNLFVVSEEFYNSSKFLMDYVSGKWNSPSGFSSYKCSYWEMIGLFGYNTLTTAISKSIINLLPHYKARMKARIYKIDDWGGANITIIVDRTTLFISKLNSLGNENGFYYGNLCEQSNNENTFFIDEEFSHFASSMNILYTSTLEKSEGAWGISHVGFYIYLCNSSMLCVNFVSS